MKYCHPAYDFMPMDHETAIDMIIANDIQPAEVFEKLRENIADDPWYYLEQLSNATLENLFLEDMLDIERNMAQCVLDWDWETMTDEEVEERNKEFQNDCY